MERIHHKDIATL